MTTPATSEAVGATAPSTTPEQKSTRIATVDWMRGLVMVLMVVDHVSMAFDVTHISQDSAMFPDAATMALPAGPFFKRWITAICAPAFVFLAGTAVGIRCVALSFN
jgi:uncharacterized membrane protein